jgi:hypothetical protein
MVAGFVAAPAVVGAAGEVAGFAVGAGAAEAAGDVPAVVPAAALDGRDCVAAFSRFGVAG